MEGQISSEFFSFIEHFLKLSNMEFFFYLQQIFIDQIPLLLDISAFSKVIQVYS